MSNLLMDDLRQRKEGFVLYCLILAHFIIMLLRWTPASISRYRSVIGYYIHDALVARGPLPAAHWVHSYTQSMSQYDITPFLTLFTPLNGSI